MMIYQTCATELIRLFNKVTEADEAYRFSLDSDLIRVLNKVIEVDAASHRHAPDTDLTRALNKVKEADEAYNVCLDTEHTGLLQILT